MKHADGSVPPTGESGSLPLPRDVSPAEVRTQLEKILRSEHFAHAENLSRFLRFVVTFALEGQGGELKEYRIGVDVFGRGDNFDPKEDTIVRVQARNLRSRLRAYYDAAPASDAITIDLPTGTYVPVFRSRQVQPQPDQRHGWRLYLLIGAAVLASNFLVYRLARQPSVPVVHARLLVIGFSAESSTRGLEYYVSGFTTDLASMLWKSGKINAVHLGRRTPLSPENPAELGQQFHTAAVLTMNIAKPTPKLQVEARLFDSGKGMLMWEKNFLEDEKNAFRIQEDIARAVFGKMHAGSVEVRAIHTTSDPAVYDRYLQVAAANLQETGVRQESLQRLDQALAKAPNYAPLYAQLARVHGVTYSEDHLPESLRKAQQAAARALRLDATLGEAHLWAGQIAERRLDWETAVQQYQQAIALEPGLSPARYFYAVLLARLGRTDQALEQARQYQEHEPASALGLEGWILGLQRQYDRAITLLRKAHELAPGDSYVALALGDFYLQQGEFDQALRIFQATAGVAAQKDRAMGYVGLAHALAGRREEALHVLWQLEDQSKNGRVAPTALALVHAGLGNKDAAFQWLEKALTEDLFMVTYLRMDPIYDSLRGDARYFVLLRKLKLN